tara:strand:+ start:19373 stop:20050 length:678 start_codon:yes stop_codon:yes gene_type:complete
MALTIEEATGKISELTSKLDEFRGNNVRLTELLEKFGDVTPEQVAEAQEVQAAKERKELVDSKDIGAALDAQAEKLKADFEARLEAVTAELGTTRDSLREVSVTSVLKTEAIAAGVRPEAVGDVVEGIQHGFESENGALVRMQDGKPVLSADPARVGENQTSGEFFAAYALAKPFFFSSSGGGGKTSAEGNPGSVRTITRAEFQSGQFNEQIQKNEVVVEGYGDQ